MVQQIKFIVHLYEAHGQLVVSSGTAKAGAGRIISTRRLEGVQAGSSPAECFRAMIEALSPSGGD